MRKPLVFSFRFWCFLFFLFSPLLQAFEIPSEFARLEKKIEGTSGKTILLIQEAHSDYHVQKNIAGLLRYLIEFHDFYLVLAEGGWGNVSLSYLRNYGSPNGRLKIAEEYLKAGKISAEEYLDITSGLDLELWGVEDPKLYEQNMKAFLAIHSEQQKWLSELSKLKSGLDALAEKIFPEPLREFRKKQEAFEDQTISLLEYLHFLVRLLPSLSLRGAVGDEAISGYGIVTAAENRSGLAMTVLSGTLNNFPTLQNLMSLSGAGGFDPEKVEWEKQELVRTLSRKMTKPELEELALHENRKTSEEELAFIQVLLAAREREAKKGTVPQVGNLKRYAQALQEGLKVDSRLLFSELRDLEDQISQKLAETAEQKELLAMQNRAALFEKLFKLELGPEDFAHLQQNPFVIPAPDLSFLRKQESSPGLTSAGIQALDSRLRGNDKTPPEDWNSELLQKALAQAQEFYVAAESREKAMIQNVLQKMDTEKETQAVLILGGFHTERLTRAFQELGFSVVIITPRIASGFDSNQHQERYFQTLKENWEPPAAESLTNFQFNPIQGDIKNVPQQ